MNKFTVILAVIFFSFTTGHAQNLLKKVPSNASMVIKYSGENFTKNLPLKKMEAYPFIKENLFKLLKIDSLTTMENTGIDFEQDLYQYMVTEDSTMNFITLLHLKNIPQFLKILDAQSIAEVKAEKKNGYEWLAVSADTYVGWNNESAMIVFSHYANPNSYYSYYTATDTASAYMDSLAKMATVDTAAMAAVPEETEKPSKDIQKSKTITPKSKATQKKSPAKPVKGKKKQKAPAKEPEVVEEIRDAPPIDEATIDKANDEEITVVEPITGYYDSAYEIKRKDWELEQEKITAARQKKVSTELIENGFNKPINSVENEVSYKKIIDPAAHVSGWFNYADLMQQYWSALYGGMFFPRYSRYPRIYGGLGRSFDGIDNADKIGIHSAVNIFFDKDKMRVEQKTYTGETDMKNFGKDLFNSKQSEGLAKLVNPDNIGYFSASVNTEAMSKYYYKWIKQYFNSISFIGEYSDIVNVYVDLLEIIIDEKAISELMPGNYMFVLHDMKTKEVTYTDYVYDDDFKSTEVKKKKQELSPNFTFAMETRNEAFMKKVAGVPLKYTKKGDYNYLDRGGYYELVFDSAKNVLNSLYFMVKDGRVIITTSKANIDMALANSGYNLDAETKKSILKNNYSFKLNSKRLIQQIGPELSTGVNKKISNYLMENIGDLKMESKLEDGMIQGTTTMAITGNHTNSLEFFFNVIDSINNIIKKDKEESEQKFD